MPRLEVKSTLALKKADTQHAQMPPCDVVFAHLDAVENQLPQLLNGNAKNCPFFVFVLNGQTKQEMKFNSCALEFVQIPLTLSDIHSLENRLLDLCAIRQECESFAPSYYSALQHLLENWRRRNWQQIVLPDVKGFSIVAPQELLRLEGEGTYTTAFLCNGGRVLTCKAIRHFEEVLDTYGFVRIHDDQIINLNHIRSWQYEKGVEIELIDGASIKVSGRRVPLFLEAFQRWTKSGGNYRAPGI